MASNSILKLQVDDKQYEASLKNAQQGLKALQDALRNSGKSFADVDKQTEEYVRALGKMGTTAKTARGGIGEMSSAFVELSRVEKQLTDQERQSPVGKALTESLAQLKQRTIDAKNELQGLENQIKNVGEVKLPDVGGGGLFSGDKLSGMLQVFGGNLMTKAAGFAASFATEIGSCVQQGIELARQGEGVRIAFERLGRGDILDGLREATHGTVTDIELMKAAVKFNDFKLPVEELGTMLAFAQQKAKDTGQSVDYMVDSIVTGLGRKSLMILDNLGLSAAEIKEKMKQTGDMTKAVGAIIREQMAKAGDYVETAADRAAQANVSLQNKMEELGRKFAPVEEASNQLWTSMKIGILDIIGGPLARLLNGLTEAGRLKNQLNDLNGGNGGETRTESMLRMLREYSGGGRGMEGKRDLYNRQVASFNQQEQQAWREANRLRKDLDNMEKQKRDDPTRSSDLLPFINDTRRRLEAAENRAKAIQTMSAQYQKGAQDIFNPKPTTTATTTTTTTKGTKKDLDELQKVQAKISALTKEAYTADESRQEQIRKEIAGLQEQEKKLISIKELVTGTAKGPDLDKLFPDMSARNYNTGYAGSAKAKVDSATVDLAMGPLNTDSINAYISTMKSALKDADFGSDLYNSLTEKLSDASTMTAALQQAMTSGVSGVDLTSVAEEMKQKLLEGDISEDAWQEFLDKLNEKIEDADLKLTFDVDSNKIETVAKKQQKDAQAMAKDWQAAGTAINAVGQAMSQIEDPAAKVLGTIAQAVATMALSYSQAAASPAVTSTGWGWIAFAATGVATMLSSIAAIKNATSGFASGGVIPGNSYSGDNMRGITPDGNVYGLNAGEVVLNRAQQGVLAASLDGGAMNGVMLDTVITAEEIRLVLNNNGRRTGRGEYVQTR